MSYSDSFPSVSPSWQCNFSANGGRLDPRITFSRSDTPPTYAAPSAVHYWSNEKHLSSENLLLQSSDFDTTWANSRLASPTANQTDPSGGTDGYTLTEDSSSGAHRLTQSVTATGDLAFTVYAKQNSGTRYLTLGFFNGNNDTVLAVYDLAGGSPVTATGSSSTYSSVSTSQTASGNGYYKCVLKATGTVTLAGVNLNDASTTAGLDTTLARKVYTGDGSSSIDVAFASLSSVGGTTYQATTTQIHREYAPTLKSVSTAGQPRFEYSPTDSASEAIGSSRGLLIEGSSTNLVTYSEDSTQWTVNNHGSTANAAIAPDGTLTASLMVPNSIVANRYFYANNCTYASGTTYTGSVYVKAAGNNFCQLVFPSTTFGLNAYANYTLSGAGAVSAGSSATGTIEAVGNGFYRVSLTATATASTTDATVIVTDIDSAADARFPATTGNDYDGLIVWGFQTEANSFASSYIKSNSGSATTRAADSASVATAEFGYTGGPVSGVVDAVNIGTANYPTFATITDSTGNQRVMLQGGLTSAQVETIVKSDGATVASPQSTLNTTASKVGFRSDTNNFASVVNGGTVSTDTSGPIPASASTLHIGQNQNSQYQVNGNIKRIALYGEALSDTNLQALTS